MDSYEGILMSFNKDSRTWEHMDESKKTKSKLNFVVQNNINRLVGMKSKTNDIILQADIVPDTKIHRSTENFVTFKSRDKTYGVRLSTVDLTESFLQILETCKKNVPFTDASSTRIPNTTSTFESKLSLNTRASVAPPQPPQNSPRPPPPPQQSQNSPRPQPPQPPQNSPRPPQQPQNLPRPPQPPQPQNSPKQQPPPPFYQSLSKPPQIAPSSDNFPSTPFPPPNIPSPPLTESSSCDVPPPPPMSTLTTSVPPVSSSDGGSSGGGGLDLSSALSNVKLKKSSTKIERPPVEKPAANSSGGGGDMMSEMAARLQRRKNQINTTEIQQTTQTTTPVLQTMNLRKAPSLRMKESTIDQESSTPTLCRPSDIKKNSVFNKVDTRADLVEQSTERTYNVGPRQSIRNQVTLIDQNDGIQKTPSQISLNDTSDIKAELQKIKMEIFSKIEQMKNEIMNEIKRNANN